VSNYILLSLCVLFLIKTSLRLIKAEIIAFWVSYHSFLTIPCIPREKPRERERKTKSERLHLFYPIQIWFSRSFLSLPLSLLAIIIFHKAVTICEIFGFREKMIKMKELLTPLLPTS